MSHLMSYTPDWTQWRSRRTAQHKEILRLHGDYRDVLAAELQRRKTLSPHYSLRDFAKDLQMSPSQLSRVLRGQRGMSRKSAEKVVASLGLHGLMAANFVFRVQALSARSIALRSMANLALKRDPLKRAESEYNKLRNQRPSWIEQVRLVARSTFLRPPDPLVHWRIQRCGFA